MSDQKPNTLEKELKEQDESVEEEEFELTVQFYKSLEAIYTKLKETCPDLDRHQEVTKKIDYLFSKDAGMSWANAYQIEQLMIPLYNDNALKVELGSRLVEAEGSLSAKQITYYQEQAQNADRGLKLALLDNLINDIQWRNQMRQLHRSYSTLTRKNTGIVFITSVGFFIATFIIFRLWIQGQYAPMFEVATVAITSGLMGAAFSTLTGLRDRLLSATLDELKMQYRLPYILSRTIIGIGAALIFGFFMQGDLLTGTVFPQFNYIDGELLRLDPANLARLIVWSFIAGFSEKLVPNIISQAEQKATVKSS